MSYIPDRVRTKRKYGWRCLRYSARNNTIIFLLDDCGVERARAAIFNSLSFNTPFAMQWLCVFFLRSAREYMYVYIICAWFHFSFKIYQYMNTTLVYTIRATIILSAHYYRQHAYNREHIYVVVGNKNIASNQHIHWEHSK